MAQSTDTRWVSEAVVEFLRGPLYTHPLMHFIDNKCLIFTPEEENKLEYTVIHEEFKACVDGLLTGFLEELGVAPEEFFRIAEQATDKLTSFVVQTILTVDDFLLFKAMMVKRNMDLTNQVLSGLEELQAAAQSAKRGAPARSSSSKGGGAAKQIDEAAVAKQLEEAVRLSTEAYAKDARGLKLQQLMRSLQLQDEDVALAIAIAESLKDSAKSQAELAELEQALALSLALEAEQRRLAAAQAAGQVAGDIAGMGQGNSKAAGAKGAAKAGGANELLHGAFPEPAPLDMAPLPAFQGVPEPKPSKVEPLAPLKIGPNTGAERLAAIAAAAAHAASILSESLDTTEEAPAGSSGASSGAAGSSGFVPEPLKLGSGKQKPPSAPPKEKFVPAPLNLPDKAARPLESIPSPDELAGDKRTSGTFGKGGVHSRALGFKSGVGGLDIAAVREAAAAAAATQKNLIAAQKGAGKEADDAAVAWLQDAKKALVAKKDLEREAEMAKYQEQQKASKGPGMKARTGTGGGAQPPKEDELEAKRAALRDRLAQKMKQELISQS